MEKKTDTVFSERPMAVLDICDRNVFMQKMGLW